MSWLALSALFEYLWYGSTAFKNILILSVQGPTLGGPRTERVNWAFGYSSTTIIVYNPFYQQIKSLLIGNEMSV